MGRRVRVHSNCFAFTFDDSYRHAATAAAGPPALDIARAKLE